MSNHFRGPAAAPAASSQTSQEIGCQETKSYAGTFISHLLNIELLGKGYLTNFVFCVVGAVVVLWIWKKIFS